MQCIKDLFQVYCELDIWAVGNQPTNGDITTLVDESWYNIKKKDEDLNRFDFRINVKAESPQKVSIASNIERATKGDLYANLIAASPQVEGNLFSHW